MLHTSAHYTGSGRAVRHGPAACAAAQKALACLLPMCLLVSISPPRNTATAFLGSAEPFLGPELRSWEELQTRSWDGFLARTPGTPNLSNLSPVLQPHHHTRPLVVNWDPPPAARLTTRVLVPTVAGGPWVPLTVTASATSSGAVQLPPLLLTLTEVTERLPGAKLRV
jgi:hypothetical protein